jgi:hypothetical protein
MHKKTAVKKEKWLLFGDWYIHPDFDKKQNISPWKPAVLWHLPYMVAHKCPDGSIQGLVGPGIHKSKRTGLIKVYGKCRKCGSPVGKEIHTVINMLKAL